jgi:hypothetical protein
MNISVRQNKIGCKPAESQGATKSPRKEIDSANLPQRGWFAQPN